MNGIRMRTRSSWFFALVLSLLAGVAWAQADASAGSDFLKLLDTKKYAESWDAASNYLKQSVSREDWTQQMVKTRDTIGAVASRTLVEAKPEKDPRGAPPGDYLLMTYKTVFASQGAPRTETLALIKSADGKWRAVDYFVR